MEISSQPQWAFIVNPVAGNGISLLIEPKLVLSS